MPYSQTLPHSDKGLQQMCIPLVSFHNGLICCWRDCLLKKENQIIICSPSCHSKPFFLWNIKENILKYVGPIEFHSVDKKPKKTKKKNNYGSQWNLKHMVINISAAYQNILQVWNDMKVSKWLQIFLFIFIYLFKPGSHCAILAMIWSSETNLENPKRFL